MLVLVTLCWGVSYYMMDISLEDLGPFTLNAFRFLGAFAVAGAIAFPKIKNVNKTTLLYALAVGASLTFVYIGATCGVLYTTLSNAAFLCAMTVIFVPIIGFLVFRRKPEKRVAFAIFVSFVGITLLTLKDDFSINAANLKGDLLSLMCAICYAIDLLITDKAVSNEKVDAFQLGVFQLGFTGVFMLLLSLLFESPHLPGSGRVWFCTAFLTVFCTGVAFIVQAVAQKYTDPSHVGIIFTLEPVFASVVAYFFAHEVLSPKAYLGAALMLAALLISETGGRKEREGETEPKTTR